MGFFAVIRNSSSNKQSFEVLACHLNLWSLPGLGCRLFFWDVGLRLKVGAEGQLTDFQIALPFGTEDGCLTDLYDEMIQEKVAKLVFGQDVTVTDSVLTLQGDRGSESFRAIRVSEEHTSRSEPLSGPSYSVWTIKPSAAIEINQEVYLRIRFEMTGLGRTWLKNSVKNGAVIDLRIADIRESVGVDKWRDLHDNIVSIKTLNVFVIAPASMLHRASSPALHYMRLYEGSVWNSYLGRNPRRRKEEKLTIYYWRSPPKNDAVESKPEINHEKPFRAFLVLSQEPEPFSTVKLLLTVLFVFMAVIAANQITPYLPSTHSSLIDAVYESLAVEKQKWIIGAGGLTIAGLIAKFRDLLKLPQQVKTGRNLIAKRHHAFQMWWYRR